MATKRRGILRYVPKRYFPSRRPVRTALPGGCGDLITDYEGIGGHEAFRGELGAMYFANLASDGALLGLRLRTARGKGGG
jgi:hypothetical protein